ncbi:hypothetical protein AAG906_019017 [Vitis piasezkii]
MAPKKNVSSARASEVREKATDKLDVKEFRERFSIPNGVTIELLKEEVPFSAEKLGGRAIVFTKEHFNAGLRFPLPSLFKEFLHFTQIPPAFIHPNVVRVLMGCSIINMLYKLDLTLMEVFFLYSLKKANTDIFSLSAHLPSLQVVTELPDSTKGGAKGLVVVRGGWAGLVEQETKPFSPNNTVKIPDRDLRGHLVDWVEKEPFACVNKLFEIDALERHYKTLLSAQNLMAVVRVSQDYRGAREAPYLEGALDLPGGQRGDLGIQAPEDRDKRKDEGTIRKAPGQKRGADSAPEEVPAKRKKLVKKHGKDVKDPPPPLDLGPPKVTHEADVMIEEPVNAAPPSLSSGPGHVAGLHHSGPSLARASINHPGDLNPDLVMVKHNPMEEAGAESQSQPRDDPDNLTLVLVKGPLPTKPRSVRNLRSGLFGRLQDRQQEIEVSCASPLNACPEGGGAEIATEAPAAPVIILDADSPDKIDPVKGVEAPCPEQKLLPVDSSRGGPADDASCSSCSSFSYTELEHKLKQIPPGSPDILPSAEMFDKVESLICGLRCMVKQHDLFADLLRTADYMKLFASRHKENENQLRQRAEEAENDLSVAYEEIEDLRAELAEAKSREEATASRLCESEDEVARFRGEARHFRTEVSIEKKQNEELRLRLAAQKEELERAFAVEREELAAEYQQQVDDTFIFGYRCCMKKHGIKRDTPSIPPGEEEKLQEKPAPQ